MAAAGMWYWALLFNCNEGAQQWGKNRKRGLRPYFKGSNTLGRHALAEGDGRLLLQSLPKRGCHLPSPPIFERKTTAFLVGSRPVGEVFLEKTSFNR